MPSPHGRPLRAGCMSQPMALALAHYRWGQPCCHRRMLPRLGKHGCEGVYAGRPGMANTVRNDMIQDATPARKNITWHSECAFIFKLKQEVYLRLLNAAGPWPNRASGRGAEAAFGGPAVTDPERPTKPGTRQPSKVPNIGAWTGLPTIWAPKTATRKMTWVLLELIPWHCVKQWAKPSNGHCDTWRAPRGSTPPLTIRRSHNPSCPRVGPPRMSPDHRIKTPEYAHVARRRWATLRAARATASGASGAPPPGRRPRARRT